MTNKTLRGDVTIWAAYPEAFNNPALPTSAEMNNVEFVKEISCAVEDSYTLNAVASNTDDSLSVCDTGNVSNPTSKNYEASIDTFADESATAAGKFNLSRDLFSTKGRDFYLIKRLNVKQGLNVAAGHVLYLYLVKTDNQQLVTERGSVVKYGNRFKPLGVIYEEVEVAA